MRITDRMKRRSIAIGCSIASRSSANWFCTGIRSTAPGTAAPVPHVGELGRPKVGQGQHLAGGGGGRGLLDPFGRAALTVVGDLSRGADVLGHVGDADRPCAVGLVDGGLHLVTREDRAEVLGCSREDLGPGEVAGPRAGAVLGRARLDQRGVGHTVDADPGGRGLLSGGGPDGRNLPVTLDTRERGPAGDVPRPVRRTCRAARAAGVGSLPRHRSQRRRGSPARRGCQGPPPARQLRVYVGGPGRCHRDTCGTGADRQHCHHRQQGPPSRGSSSLKHGASGRTDSRPATTGSRQAASPGRASLDVPGRLRRALTRRGIHPTGAATASRTAPACRPAAPCGFPPRRSSPGRGPRCGPCGRWWRAGGR